jgi:uncharacterized protein YcbX
MSEIAVSALFVYPIKSARGISVQAAAVADRGFEHDRRFMLVDEDGTFLTQRQLPRMACIEVGLETEGLAVDAPRMSTLRVPLHPRGDERMVTVFSDRCRAVSVGGDASRWFSEALGARCDLVYMPAETHRLTNRRYTPEARRVSFADAFPFLLLSTASLADLNLRLAEAVPIDRFRPNIVVGGCEAYAEDTWRTFSIGGVCFEVVKPCSRCTIPNTDQVTGEVGDEPVRTLSTYRKQSGKVMFGQNLVHTGEGSVRVGDPVRDIP